MTAKLWQPEMGRHFRRYDDIESSGIVVVDGAIADAG